MPFRADSLESDAGSVAPDEGYILYTDASMPYLAFKGTSPTVQSRRRFPGTNRKTPSKIYMLYEVDSGGTADIEIFDSTNGQTIASVTGLSAAAWTILDMGTLSNLSATPAIWELILTTSAANKSIRIGSIEIEY